MAEDKRDLEVRGASVDEAIDAGLSQLGVARSDVIVEVVDEGGGGFLGIGGRDAIVRLKVLGRPKFEERKTEPVAVEAAEAVTDEAGEDQPCGR